MVNDHQPLDAFRPGADILFSAEFLNQPEHWIVLVLVVAFCLGVAHSLIIYLRAVGTLRRDIDTTKPSLSDVERLAVTTQQAVPFVIVLVPARDEAAVITNTIVRLSRLEYPSCRFAAVIVTDERETRSSTSVRTTHEIATELARRYNSDTSTPRFYIVSVPAWYSGRFESEAMSYQRSTKGRALNYGLQFIHRHPRLAGADMLGVLDADGRLHPQVLCEVATKRLLNGTRLLQGPVFQISNYRHVDMVGRAAAIGFSVYHLSTLAYRLRRERQTPEFLAGTNYFIDLRDLTDVGGWNETALAEDAELGFRLFIQKGLRPRWLTCHELEQTPPDRRTYFKQRERWALGHFQLLSAIKRLQVPLRQKIALSLRVLSGVLKSPLDIGLPLLGWAALLLGWAEEGPSWLHWTMVCLLLLSVFVWDFFGRGARMLAKYGPVAADSWLKRRREELLFILAMPWLMGVQALPRLSAACKYLARSEAGASWEKTPRTVELETHAVDEPVVLHKDLIAQVKKLPERVVDVRKVSRRRPRRRQSRS